MNLLGILPKLGDLHKDEVVWCVRCKGLRLDVLYDGWPFPNACLDIDFVLDCLNQTIWQVSSTKEAIKLLQAYRDSTNE